MNTPMPEIVDSLINNAKEIQYGEVGVTLKIHAGRIVSINYSTTKSTRDMAPAVHK